MLYPSELRGRTEKTLVSPRLGRWKDLERRRKTAKKPCPWLRLGRSLISCNRHDDRLRRLRPLLVEIGVLLSKRRLQVVVRCDVVVFEHGSRQLPADSHGDRFPRVLPD